MTGGLLKMPPLSAKALGQEWVRVTSVKGKVDGFSLPW